MGIRMLEQFIAETDDLKDFKLLLKTALKIKFYAPANSAPAYQKISMFLNGCNYGYWNLTNDEATKRSNEGRRLVCTFANYISANSKNNKDLFEIPMRRVETGSDKYAHKFKWTNYDEVIDKVLEQLNDAQKSCEGMSVPKWMQDTDGSTGISYKIECDHNQMYISIGYCYYSK